MKKAISKVMNKAKGMIQNARKKAAMLSLAASTALIAGSAKLTAFAAENGSSSSFDVSTVMQSAVDTTKTQMLSVLGIVVPAIVVITASVVGIKFGISWLKKVRG
ncbi:MAG: hypothetical protein K2K46_00025 [Lachnospiraceae bacterium]|nr:hypothetical protein [Lachnospiraceae bacterium]